MQVWGVDPSSKCGLAIWDTETHLCSAHCEVIENKRKNDFYWYAVVLGRTLVARAKRFGKPDLIVIEQGSQSSQGTGIDGIIWVWNVIGSVNAVFGAYGTPIATITPSAWRSPFYGKGFVPPQIPIMDKDGVQEKDRFGRLKFKNDWKAAAIVKCGAEGVVLPPQKTIAHNAAEALGIAHSWAHSSIINPEFERAFINLRRSWDRGQRGDLFGAAA